ncbi:argininosuccinate synthase [Fusarium mexicanum]|uniref:argininosuccinate synthase n=1 Tax=Fusarium mexicanum TaxID=751941 RepID=A0A8H5IHK4_9HYPO|nr:argininosuccinate synthase [Fusarium mexicanum]
MPVSSTPKAPWSQDENLVHCSYEAGILEDPDHTPPKDLWTQTVDPLEALDKPLDFTVYFEKGLPVKVAIPDQQATDSVELFKLLNKIGHGHGVGRIDIVENRWAGLKSRGCYDTPGLTIARLADVDLEGLVLDSKVRKLRDKFATIEWSQCLYYGMSLLNAHLRAYKGNVYVLGRSSETSSLYSQEDTSMGSLDTLSPMDSTGFIAIQSIRLEKYGAQKAKDGQPLSQS